MESVLTIFEVSDRLFLLLFFPSLFISLAVFFWGINLLWRTSIENRELKRKSGS